MTGVFSVTVETGSVVLQEMYSPLMSCSGKSFMW